MNPHRPRLVVLGLISTLIVAGACIGPEGGRRGGETPTAPVVPGLPLNNLSGRVLDFDTRQPLVGARINAMIDSTVSTENGQYALANLRVHVVQVVTTMVGFDTLRSEVPLQSNTQVTFLLRQAPAAAAITP